MNWQQYSFYFSGHKMASSTTRNKCIKEFNIKEEDPLMSMPDGRNVFCKVCEKVFGVVQKSQLGQHQKSALHTSNIQLKGKRSVSQSQLEDVLTPKPKRLKTKALGKELFEAMLAAHAREANIPWIKLENPKLHGFLETNLGISLPDEATLRKVYLQECDKDVTKEIQTSPQDSSIWIGVDEAT